MEGLETGLSHHMAGHSSLGLLYIVASCISEFYQGDRIIGEFGDGMQLVACKVQWMRVGIRAAYLQETLLLTE